MIFSEKFEVTIALHYRVHGAEIYGGEGSVGYAEQKLTLTPDATPENICDAAAERLRSNMAEWLGVPAEKLEYITGEEYERETEDEEAE